MAHQHPVKDTDLHFVIDPVTRVIKNNSGKIVIMQHDHQSEILTFELPRYIDTHDMSLSNTVRVHYINIGSSSKYEPVSGVYEITDLQIDPENENLVTCSWTLTNNTTQLEGTLNFIIRFSCLTGDTIDYSWSTAIYSGIIVAKTIDSSDYVMTAIPDILEQWKASLKGDPFTYEDFTPEQLEGLRGPAGVIVSETEPTNEDHPVWVRPSGEYVVENLGISGATVGQTVKIKAVDENGNPTEWEASDATPLKLVGEYTLSENALRFDVENLDISANAISIILGGITSSPGAALTVYLNGVKLAKYGGGMGNDTKIWLWKQDGTWYLKALMSNNGIHNGNFATGSVVSPITSIGITNQYAENNSNEDITQGNYFNSGTKMRIYEGVMPNVGY